MRHWFIVGLLSTILFPSTAQAKWLRADTTHFILYSDGTERELREDAVKVERFDQMMRVISGIGDDSGQVKLTVYFVRTDKAVQSLSTDKAKNLAGFYNASASGAIAVVPRYADGQRESDSVAETADIILFHEYAHHLMLQYFPASYPEWYVEGFAEYIGNSRLEKGGLVKVGLPNVNRAYSLLESKPFPIETLLGSRVDVSNATRTDQFYARSWLLTHYLTMAPARKGQLATYLKAVGSGQPSLDAARAVFGDLKVLDKEISRYLLGAIAYRKLSGLPPLSQNFAVRPLDEGEGEVLLLQMQLSRGTKADEAEPLAVKLRALAARYPTHRAVMTALAEAELDAKHPAAALTAADAALKADPLNGRAQLWKGLAMMRSLDDANDDAKPKWAAARSWIVKANRSNPEDPLPLISYFQSFSIEGKAAPSVALDGLAKAIELVPQDSGTRITYAMAMAQKKKYAEAIAAIRPVAYNPHGGGSATFARNLITRFEKARDTGSDLDETDQPVEEPAKL